MFDAPSVSITHSSDSQLTCKILAKPTNMRTHVKVSVPGQKDSKNRVNLGFGLRVSRVFICSCMVVESCGKKKHEGDISVCYCIDMGRTSKAKKHIFPPPPPKGNQKPARSGR